MAGKFVLYDGLERKRSAGSGNAETGKRSKVAARRDTPFPTSALVTIRCINRYVNKILKRLPVGIERTDGARHEEGSRGRPKNQDLIRRNLKYYFRFLTRSAAHRPLACCLAQVSQRHVKKKREPGEPAPSGSYLFGLT